MESKTRITCQHCKKSSLMDDSKLVKYYNKTINLACASCGKKTAITVDAELFNKKKETVKSEKKEEFKDEFPTEISDGDKNSFFKATLLVEKNDYHPEQRFDLMPGTHIIGRYHTDYETDNKKSIRTQDKTIGKAHCQINIFPYKDKLRASLKDLNSLNHTYVLNAESINQLSPDDEYLLVNGSRIKIGRSFLSFITS